VAEQVGIGGVVAALSVTSDLARGHAPGEAMRACLLATEVARRAGVAGPRLSDVYYATLLRYAGCTATSHEYAAALGGDDIAVRAGGDMIDPTRPQEGLRFLAGLAHGMERARILGRAPVAARFFGEAARADCEVGAALTRRLRLPDVVGTAVLDAFERWDGRGAPQRKAADEIAEASRYAATAYAAVMFDEVYGPEAAAEVVRRWSGRALDPAIAAIVLDGGAELLALASPDDPWAAVVDAEPDPRRTFRGDDALDDALAGFGDAADLKTPWFHGHSAGVARLARDAAERTLEPGLARLVFRAGLVHDLGRVAVPTGVWERPGPLRRDEWELVRLHPYHSGRILARDPALAPLASLASRHHERTDGSGYPAGIRGHDVDSAAGVLAAADVMHALGEARPHRPAAALDAAAHALTRMPLDRDAIRAVVDAAGGPAPKLPPLPADLSERELEVLRRLVAGRTKRQIASQLVISHSTVHTHTVHIYEKCGVTTRAGLAMFAMSNGLAARID
jgi:HD-GYP domain-containing protein (c-di-GMP phosphodiesterase class II)